MHLPNPLLTLVSKGSFINIYFQEEPSRAGPIIPGRDAPCSLPARRTHRTMIPGFHMLSLEQASPALDPAALPAAIVPGLYVHIPFCFHKCHYCDFYSITRKTSSE